jgi:hypothetical protein
MQDLTPDAADALLADGRAAGHRLGPLRSRRSILVGPLPWDFDEIVERHARVGVTVVAAERVAADGPLTLTLPAFCLRGVKPSSA